MKAQKVKGLPLSVAYQFAIDHGLQADVKNIRTMAINPQKNPTVVRKGYMVALLDQHGLLHTFMENHWPEGKSDWGTTKRKWYLKLKSENEGGTEGNEAEEESGD